MDKKKRQEKGDPTSSQQAKLDNTEKRYSVKKFVMAHSCKEAIEKEKNIAPDEVWIDEDWKKEHADFKGADAIGFTVYTD